MLANARPCIRFRCECIKKESLTSFLAPELFIFAANERIH